MGWTRKDLLTIRELEPAEILTLVDTAASLQEIATREIKKVPALRGKTIVNLFYENSTRTRTSFEIAGKWLSADVVNFSASGSSAAKGESFVDTARNIAAMSPDVVVVRHSSSGAPALLALELSGAIVNAGDGPDEHHTQADVLIMHPGPVNRGVELSPEVADGPYSVILDQVSRGVAVRMAVLLLLAGGRSAEAPTP